MKFRVWCKDHNEWEKDPIFLSQDGVPHHWLRAGRGLQLVPIRPEQHIVQFSTGLRDKNGCEIFEGDIVDGYGDTKISTGLSQVSIGPFGIRFQRITPSGHLINVTVFECVIVGNIFENPELLNGRQNTDSLSKRN